MHEESQQNQLPLRSYGMTPRGEPMPQTIEEWKHLVDLDEKVMLRDKETISMLKMKVNNLEQKLKAKKPAVVSSTSTKISTKECPQCGATNLLTFTSMNMKTCSTCRIDIPWYLEEGQKPLF